LHRDIRMNPFEAAREKDIVDVIGRDVRLRKSGHVHKGLCPFHDDYEPSLVVYQDSFWCFGCGVGGSVIDYVMLRERCGSLEAARKLVGGSFLPYVRRPARQKTIAPAVPRWVLGYWHGKLLAGCRTYFHSRGFTDETIDLLQWGWDGRRFTIPVWDGVPGESRVHQVARRRCDEVEMRQLREEMPEADEQTLREALPQKYLNIWGYGGNHLYGKWSLKGPVLYVFFGLLTAAMAIQDGLPACSPSNGVGSWQDEWSQYFQEADTVWVLQDNTPSERDATHLVAASIGGHARVVVTPGEGDYADYKVGGGTVKEFLEYIEKEN